MMNARCNQLQNVQPDDKTQFRVRRRHLANKSVLKSENLGPTLGVIQTGSEKSTTSKRSNIPGKIYRMDTWRMEEIARTSAGILHKNVHTITGSSFENQQVLQTKPREQCFFVFCGYVNRERTQCALHMTSKCDSPPEI